MLSPARQVLFDAPAMMVGPALAGVWRRTGTLLALLLYLCSAASSLADEFRIKSLKEPVSIAGAWRFQTGDDLARAQPDFNDEGWPSVLVPRDLRKQGYNRYTGIAWYRFSLLFDLDDEELRPDLDHLGITMGKVQSAYELYAGGILLGGVGKLPPEPEIVYDRTRTYAIPRAALDENGRIVFAVRVWRHQPSIGRASSGAYEGPLLVGTVLDLAFTRGLKQLPLLVLSALYLVFGLYHLYIYRRNPQLRQYLWFGLLTIAFGVYSISVSQWKYVVDVPFLLLKKIEYGALYLMPALGLQTIWSLLGYRPTRWPRLYQRSFVALAAIAMLYPGYPILFVTLTPFQVWSMPALFGLLAQVIWYSLGGASIARTEARTILVGVLVFAVTAVHDIMAEQGLLHTPRLVPLGFGVMLVSMAISLANRFTLMFSSLEARVNERTQELIEANVRLREAARSDPLTGLLNRRGFAERADEEVTRARRNRRGFALVMADIDGFKAFNDKFGHACGDFVLEQVARLTREQLREVDVIARWGGEEFIFLLPETTLEGGAILAEKLRATIAARRFSYGGRELRLTLTFGVAEFTEGMTFDDCLALADRALYSGKAAGRNVVEMERERSFKAKPSGAKPA